MTTIEELREHLSDPDPTNLKLSRIPNSILDLVIELAQLKLAAYVIERERRRKVQSDADNGAGKSTPR